MKKPLNQYFDHTLLKPEATGADIHTLCKEAWQGSFYAVCVNSSQVETAAAALAALGAETVKIAAVAGFPLGACATEVKAFEAAWACQRGASEIDMVLHVGALKEKRYDYVRDDIRAVTEAVRNAGPSGVPIPVKVILETCLLTEPEIIKACQLAEEGGAAFVKTSTGFSTGGAQVRHVELMRRAVGDRLQVKASGGIRDLKTVMSMIEAGADRIGASASTAIMEELKQIGI